MDGQETYQDAHVIDGIHQQTLKVIAFEGSAPLQPTLPAKENK